MQKVAKFAGVTVGTGAFIGFSVVAWLYAHRLDAADAAANQTGVATALSAPGSNSVNGFSGIATPTPGLSVSPTGDQGLSSVEPNGGLGSSSPSSGSSNTSTASDSSANELPGPSGFSVYDQYKDNATALFIDVKAGTGAAVAKDSKVTLQYRGYLTNGTEFDDSYATGKPFSFTEGANAVIAGFEESVYGMKVGGERRLIIPPGVGYGATVQGGIPANSVLVFDVVLVSVE